LHPSSPFPAKYGMTKFADLTAEEFGNLYLMKNFQTTDKSRSTEWIPSESVDIPVSYDWRDHGAVTPVRNQEQCAGLVNLPPRTFLLVGAFTNIAAFILLLYMFFLLFERIRNDVAFIQAAPIGFLIMMVGLFTFAWAITGIILYTQHGCRRHAMGKMILSWSVVKLASVLFQMAASGNLREDVFVVAYN